MRAWAALVTLVVAGTVVSVASAQPAAAQTCALPPNASAYLATVLPEDRCDYIAFEQALASTGKLTDLSVKSSFNYPTGATPEAPGTLIRVRPLYPSPFGVNTFGVRVMYWTTTRTGQPVAATGMVLIPRVAPPSPSYERPIVLWNHGTVGINRECVFALDALLLTPEAQGLLGPYMQAPYQGVVALPDYIGMGTLPPGRQYHSYLSVTEQANAAMDMVRATRNLGPATQVGASFASFGHSQGALTTRGVAERVEGYAPELDLRASVPLAAAATDIETFIDSSVRSNQFFIGLAITGLRQAHPGLINPSEIFTTEYLNALAWLLPNNELTAFLLAVNGASPAELYLPAGDLYDQVYRNRDGKSYHWSNMQFVAPPRNERIAACAGLQTFAGMVQGLQVFKPGYQSTATWSNLVELVGPAEAVGLAPVATPINDVMFNCDGLAPIAYRPSDKARLPFCGTVSNPPAPAPVGSLPAGYVKGPAWTHVENICSQGSPAQSFTIVGDLDINADGVADPGWDLNGNGVVDKAHDHSDLAAVLGPTKDYIEYVWNTGTAGAPSNC